MKVGLTEACGAPFALGWRGQASLVEIERPTRTVVQNKPTRARPLWNAGDGDHSRLVTFGSFLVVPRQSLTQMGRTLKCEGTLKRRIVSMGKYLYIATQRRTSPRDSVNVNRNKLLQLISAIPIPRLVAAYP